MKSKILFLLPFCGFLYANSVSAQQYSKEGYKLVWSDEFEKDGIPDAKNWTYEHGFVRNEELQLYQPENAFCKNGFLPASSS